MSNYVGLVQKKFRTQLASNLVSCYVLKLMPTHLSLVAEKLE